MSQFFHHGQIKWKIFIPILTLIIYSNDTFNAATCKTIHVIIGDMYLTIS